VPPKSQLYLARLLMSLLATALLWCTSLNIVTSIVQLDSVIPLPSMKGDVVHNILKLVNETMDVRADYVACVGDYLTMCNRSLVRELELEAARVSAAEKANVQRVQTSLDAATACSTAHATALAAVTAWQALQGVGGDAAGGEHYKSSCSAGDAQYLASATGDLSAQKSATFNLITKYTGFSA